MLRATCISTPLSSVSLVDSDADELWLSADTRTFRLDAGEEVRVGTCIDHGEDERALAVVGGLLLLQSRRQLRAVHVESSEDVWTVPIDDGRFTLTTSGAIGPDAQQDWRWWDESGNEGSRIYELDPTQGVFHLRHELPYRPRYTWFRPDGLVVGRGRNLVVLGSEGTSPPMLTLPAAPGSDPAGPVPFAGTWYVSGRHETDDGPVVAFTPVEPGAGTFRVAGSRDWITASTDLLAATVIREDGCWAFAWSEPGSTSAEVYLGDRGSWIRPVGPAIVANNDDVSRFSVAPGAESPGWRTLPSPFERLSSVHGVRLRGRWWVVVKSGGAAMLCELDPIAEVVPGEHPLDLCTTWIAPPGDARARVSYVGAATGMGIAVHPEYGRLTFDNRVPTPVAKGDAIEILERHGSQLYAWVPVGGGGPSETEVEELPAPCVEAPAVQAFEPHNVLARWSERARRAGVPTPKTLQLIFRAFDANEGARSALLRALGEIDPDAELFDGIVEVLEEDGDHRELIGFAYDFEGVAIGLIAGTPGVYSYADGELWELAATVEEWVEHCLDSLDRDDDDELINRVRTLLEMGQA